MNNIKCYVDISSFQERVLDCISSGEIEKFLKQTTYTDDPDCKQAMIFGMSIAALLASDCKDDIKVEVN